MSLENWGRPDTLCSPRGKRVVIERLALPSLTSGGLYMLGREYPALGRVLAMSIEALWDLSGELSPGDEVYFDRSKTELRGIPGEPEHFILDTKDLFLRIRP